MVDLNGTERLPNVTNHTTYNFHSCSGSLPSKAVQISLSSVVMILSLLGNLLIVAVFYRNKSQKTSVHYFMVNMAISDLIIPFVFLPSFISGASNGHYWLVDGVLGTCLCKLVWFSYSVSMLVSTFSMIAIAIDRFQAVLFPLKPALISEKRYSIVIAATWITSAAFGAINLYGFRLVYFDTKLFCAFQWKPASYTWVVFKIQLLSFFFLSSTSAIVLTVLYTRIILFLFGQKNGLQLASEVVKKRAKTNRKITCMLVILVVFFYALWIPFNVESLVNYFLNSGTPCLRMIWGLPLIYPMVTPIVYYIFNEEYRQGFRKLLHCPWSCNNKYNTCFKPSVPAQCQINSCNIGRVNYSIENIELQEQ